MGLLSPWFLVGGLAIGLPLWLHLMRRTNPVRLPFSSLMFFRKRTETTVRERRLRYLLLLALRLALLLLLALAFSKPIWERPPAVLAERLPRLHIIALDTSLSMRYGDRWSRAIDEAQGIIGSLRDVDRAQVLANGPSVRVLTEATRDQAALRRSLEGLEPTDARNNFGDAIEAVRNLVADDSSPVEVHLISDLQNSSMPARFQDLVLPGSAELKLHDVAAGEFSNWTIESVRGATRVYGEERPRLEVIVASFALEAAPKTVSLQIDGRPVGSLRQEVPAGGRASFGFDLSDPPRGFSRAEFRLDPPDALPTDDTRRAALDNTEPEPVLFVSADSRQRDLLYFQTALGASAAAHFELQSASLAEAARLDPGRYSLVVLSDVPELPRSFESRLEAWVRAGGAVFVALGPNTALARQVAVTGHDVEQPLSAERGGAAFQVAGETDSSHPVADAAEGLRAVKFFLYALVQPQEDDAVPVRLGNGDPLLVEHRMDAGRVLLFASSLDNVWNDLPLTPVFVPFVAEAARYLSGSEAFSGEALLGDTLALGRRRGSDATIQVADPTGQHALTLSDSVNRELLPLDSLGFYEIRGGRRAEVVAVNPDPRESNLRRVESDILELWRSTGESSGAEVATAGGPPPEVPPWRLWRLALALLLIAVLVESFVGNRHLDAVRGD